MGDVEMNEALIAAVYKREPVWNPANHMHRNVYVLKKLWKEVAFEVQKDVKTVNARWKNLRAYFYKEQQKVNKLKEDGKTHFSTWQYYDQLLFLNGTVSEGESILSVDDENDNYSMVYEIPLEEHQTDTLASDSEDDSILREPPNKKKRVKRGLKDQLLEIEKKRLDILERECVKEKSDDLLFFESLMPFMSNIPAVRKLRLRSRIQDLILAEIEALESSSIKQEVPDIP